MDQQQPISLNHLHRDPASGGMPPDISSSTETALEIDDTESVAREELADFFKEDRIRMNMCFPLPVEDVPSGLKDDTLDKERHRHEHHLLMTLRNGCCLFDEKLDLIKGLEAWKDRINDEIHKVDMALEGIFDHSSRIDEYSRLAQKMDTMFSELFQ